MITRAKVPKIYRANTSSDEPTTYEQVVKDNRWKAAMDEEFNALINNKT